MLKLVQRLHWSVKRRGVLGTLTFLPGAIRMRIWNRLNPQGRAAMQADQDFDIKFGGIDTAGTISPVELDFAGGSRESANGYQAVGENKIRDLMRSIDIDHSRFTFIDYGSGKGRACLLASEFPFRKIIGVELSDSLNTVATTNLSSFSPPWEIKCGDIEFVLQDATRYSPPDTPLLVFMYNPFLADIMDKVVASLSASATASPREMIFFYVQPLHADVVEKYSNIQFVEEQDNWRSYRIKPGHD